MELVLHIGAHKTGTSSIQKTLHLNREHLLDNGILYPRCLGFDRHSLLVIPYSNGRVPREFWQKLGSGDEALGKARDAWYDLSRQVEKHKPRKIILSGEQFLNAGDHEGFRRAISDAVGERKTTVVCYLRDPYDLYPSSLQQVVKASHRLPVAVYVPFSPRIKAFMPFGEVEVREYDRDRLAGGDVVTDFVRSYVGVELDDVPRPANIGLTSEGTAILQAFRKDFFPEMNNVFNRETNDFIKIVRKAETSLGGKEYFGKPKLKPDVRAAIAAAAAPDIAMLKEAFGFQFSRNDLLPTGEIPRFKYHGALRVQDVLEIDPDRLQMLYRRILLDIMRPAGGVGQADT